jgi:hypothetical protein
MAARTIFDSNAAVWLRRGPLLMLSPIQRPALAHHSASTAIYPPGGIFGSVDRHGLKFIPCITFLIYERMLYTGVQICGLTSIITVSKALRTMTSTINHSTSS